jgi:hypothetical protein
VCPTCQTQQLDLERTLQSFIGMDENAEYLQPNFDPTSLKVADLRRILLFHDVDYPSSAKKAELVNMFLDNITPKAEGLLKKKNKVRASSRGIIKVEHDEYGEVQPQIYLPEVSRILLNRANCQEEAARSSPRKRRTTSVVATPAKTPPVAKTPAPRSKSSNRKSVTKPFRVLPTPSDDEPEQLFLPKSTKSKKVECFV